MPLINPQNSCTNVFLQNNIIFWIFKPQYLFIFHFPFSIFPHSTFFFFFFFFFLFLFFSPLPFHMQNLTHDRWHRLWRVWFHIRYFHFFSTIFQTKPNHDHVLGITPSSKNRQVRHWNWPHLRGKPCANTHTISNRASDNLWPHRRLRKEHGGTRFVGATFPWAA